LDEYERLNFPEHQRKNKFEAGGADIDVPIEVARLLSNIFHDSTTAHIHIDSSLTSADSWEEDHYDVMRLKKIDLSELTCKMLTANRKQLEHKKAGFDTFFEHENANDNIELDATEKQTIKTTLKKRGITEKDIDFAIQKTTNQKTLRRKIDEIKTIKTLELAIETAGERKK